MTLLATPSKAPVTRRRFLTAGACAAGGFALYAGEIERHWIEITRRDVVLPGLPSAFDGFRVAQLSDIHMDEYTEPFFLRDAVSQINRLKPDAVFFTGDLVTHQLLPKKFSIGPAWQGANILSELHCAHRYGVLGNHDALIGVEKITEALTANGISVLNNLSVPIESGGARIWLSGVGDVLEGKADPDVAIPAPIRNLPHEPIILLCHEPDFVDDLLALPSGQSVALMLSGHSHGGQIRRALRRPAHYPEFGQKVCAGMVSLWTDATPRQSRPRHSRCSLPIRLPARDFCSSRCVPLEGTCAKL